MALDLELLGEFLLEGNELLQRLDQDLVELEKNPRDRERLGAIFRCVHTLKGSSGFIPLPKLAALAHAGENLLGRLRDGQLEATASVISSLLAMVDGLRGMLGEAEASGTDGDDPRAELIAELDARAAAKQPASMARAEPARSPAPAANPTVRVDVALLDRMMNLVAELVLARNQLLRCGASVKDAAFADASQRLNLLTTELHEGVTKTRLQPIGSLFEKLPRVVRDLAVGCGKDVALETEGGGTELDRTLLEAIKDPLTHLVRNAIDHGIEKPEHRLEAGKRAQGWLQLRAFHQGGRVHLEVRDDGGGIDVARVREVAVQRGVIDAARAMRLSDRDVTQLIFQPGFSTASTVTQVSGRGVGMDVVKTNIERIGGTVDVQSIPGAGTTITLTLPLTLAIVPALIVGSAGERFAVPQASLVEVVRLGEGAAGTIEHLHGAPVYRLRGALLPLASLRGVLELGPTTRNDLHILVLHLGQSQVGLVVDEVFDTEEIVVKPISPALERLGAFAGATLMGDGTVALILDVAGLARRAHLIGNTAAPATSVREAPTSGSQSQRESLLLFQAGATPLAVALSRVASIEEVAFERVAQVGGRAVIDYRGQIVPLADLGELLGRARAASSPVLQVLVYSESGHTLGLVVERIDDVVDEVLQSKTPSTDRLLEGTAFVQGRLTELIDVREVAQRFDPRFFDARAA